jgi:lactate permease
MLIDWLLAFSPILTLLILMLGLRWGAAKAGVGGWVVAVCVAVFRFGAGMRLIALAEAKSLLLSLDVLLIIWGAFLLYQVSEEAGAMRTLCAVLPRLTTDRGMLGLLIGWAFASFLQGVGGFGVPVAVTAPILAALGFSPLAALIIPSLGHAWAVTFGSLASSFQALIVGSGVRGDELAAPSAVVLGVAGLLCGVLVAQASDGWKGVRRLGLPILVIGLAMGGTQLLLATLGLWSIAGFGGGIAGLVVAFILAGRYRGVRQEAGDATFGAAEVLLVLSGYITLIVVTLLVQAVPAVRSFLGGFALHIHFPELQTSLGYVTPAGEGRVIPILRHAGTILALSALVAYLFFKRAGRYAPGAARRILAGTARGVALPSASVIVLVGMAVIMEHAGMTEVLAQGMALAVGAAFPLMAPWVGALGAFMTGSNTNSNVVFSMLQRRTAELLGRNVPLILAGQTSGAALGSVLSPTKIVVGSGTVGMSGREGAVLRALLRYILPLLVGVGLLVWALLGIWAP